MLFPPLLLHDSYIHTFHVQPCLIRHSSLELLFESSNSVFQSTSSSVLLIPPLDTRKHLEMTLRFLRLCILPKHLLVIKNKQISIDYYNARALKRFKYEMTPSLI